MSKEIVYKLEYKEDGKPLQKQIRINFISNGMRKEWFKIENDIIEGQRLAVKHKAKIIELDGLLRTKQDTTAVKADLEDIKSRLEERVSGGFIERRISLIQKILISNGFAKNDKFVTAEFWDECIDYDIINHVIESCINKDIDLKKK